MLKFFEVGARFPENAEEIPAPAVAYVAQLVKVPAKERAAYDWAGQSLLACLQCSPQVGLFTGHPVRRP